MAYISKDDVIAGKKSNQSNDISYYTNDDGEALQIPEESIDCKNSYDDYETHRVKK